MKVDQLKPDIIVKGPLFSEPVHIIAAKPLGKSIKVEGRGLRTGMSVQAILYPAQIELLEASPEGAPYDGDSHRFRLGIEAIRLGLAYEYDPYFSLSIARVDPLPHQLEAVYDYFLPLPRIRFLLADDPGAGKTIMAGLLLKELKIRGLVKRTLIVTPANLSFQWQREMKDKFREDFEILRGEMLRAHYGSNPWQEKNQIVTSISWVSRIEDARDSLLRSHWDLIIVDEAHKMSASSPDKKTLAYQLGESLSTLTDHYLLMTATPHKGDPKAFCLFLALLDKEVYGDVKSLEEAMRKNSAPFYLRRIKEALVTFPDPDTGKVKRIFTKRDVQTIGFSIDDDEWDFYDSLTRYVEEQSIKASLEETARGRVLAFTMAMLQRRFASSIFAVRRSLERMRDKRIKILENPLAYKEELIAKKIPDDFEELTEEDQQEILDALEEVVASIDPLALKEEIGELNKLIEQARQLESREVETKLTKLKSVLTEHGLFNDPKMKLLIFTEHKDTLDYLVGKLLNWNLTVTKLHGSMKIGDRDTPGTRIYAEREFRESAQVLVATEAAGEGINLQFCWFMINYDIPWNPVRLEQRMGRIHRYGQEMDCVILNFVAANTREGRVLEKLYDRLREMRKELGSDQVFDVVGEVFPGHTLEKLFRELYVRQTSLPDIEKRIVEEIAPDRFRAITESALEGLAKRELNLFSLVGKTAEARERRLVPEVIEDFFIQAGPLVGVYAKELKQGNHLYRVGRVPKTLFSTGERLEPCFGKLGKEYRQIVFDKELLNKEATAEWVTPGHPLFEAVREDALERTRDDLSKGAVFYDLHSSEPCKLDVFNASVKDGRGNVLHKKLFLLESRMDGTLVLRQPTIFQDLALTPTGTLVPDADGLPHMDTVEETLIEEGLNPFLCEITREREKETAMIQRHVEISLNELIHRQNMRCAELMEQKEKDDGSPLLAANLKQCEDRIDELNMRLERRLGELDRERQCTIGDMTHVGSAWVLPHPERLSPSIAPMVRDDEIEARAIEAVIAYEEERGCEVESVESESRGFDLISRRTHPEDPKSFIEVRFIEVKGRSGTGEVALTSNEYKTAERLKKDYWLYAVFNCGMVPELHTVQDPARLGWAPLVKVEHYHIDAKSIKNAAKVDNGEENLK